METKPEERSMAADLLKDKQITVLMIGIQFVMVLFITVIIMIFVGKLNLGSALFSLTMSCLVWALVLYKTPVFNWCFINVKPNWAVILGSQMTYDKIRQDPRDRTRMNNLKSFREIGSGIRGKFPWEVAFESVDLKSEIIIDNGGSPLKCYTSDGVELNITWQVVLTPLRGFLTNLVRKNEDATQAFFQGTFKQKIIDWVKENDESTVLSSLGKVKLGDVFKDVFGGPDEIHDDEKNYGIFTNSPQITMITRGPKYQEAAEGVMKSKKAATATEQLKAQTPGADQNMLLAAGLAAAGIEIPGILLIPGLTGIDPQTMAGLLAAAKNVGTQTTGAKKGNK